MRWKPPAGRCRCGNPIRILDRWCLNCATKEADRRVSSYVRRRDGRCVVPGCRSRGGLDAAHIHRRRYHRIRFNPDNLVSLCREHHDYFGRNESAWRDFIEEILPGRWEHLLRLREHPGRVDLEAVLVAFERAA